MIDIYVLNKNLETVGIIDKYRSLIWADRYRELGDCEIYAEASPENIGLLQMGYYLARVDDVMVCRITKIELDTSAEDGDYLIATGTDVKGLLDQRIIWDTSICTGAVETFIRDLVTAAAIDPADTARKLKKANGNALMALAAAAGFTEQVDEQVSYKNLGDKIREYCKAYGWGYRVFLESGLLKFGLYAGTDRSSSVFFSDEYENLASTQYVNSRQQIQNVALVGGAGEGAERKKATYGTDAGVDRFEVFLDQKSLSPVIKYKELKEIYTGGSFISSGGVYIYRASSFDVLIIDAEHKAWLQANYTGTVVTVGGVEYYRISNANLATLATNSPTDETDVTLTELIYHSYLLNAGVTALAGKGETETFSGSIIPDVTFIYRMDYFLGDIVHVENEFGISADARIVEVVESVDDNGYSVEPKFEYIS